MKGYLSRCQVGSLSQDAALAREIVQLEKTISEAENARDFTDSLLDLFKANLPEEGIGRLVLLIGKLLVRNPTHVKGCEAYIGHLERLLDPEVWVTEPESRQKQWFNSFGRYAIEGMGKAGDVRAAAFLGTLLESPVFATVRPSILIALGKTARSAEHLSGVVRLLRSPQVSERINSAWALGMLGMRERSDAIPVDDLLSSVRLLLAQCRVENHPDARRAQLYALAEIGDRRGPAPHLPDEIDGELKRLLIGFTGHVSRNRSLKALDPISKIAMIARLMNEGHALDESIISTILEIRSKLK